MKKKAKIFLLLTAFVFPSLLFAQTQIIGRVTDAGSNLPLQGVTITEQGTNNVKTTDANGNFSISVKNDRAKLVISSVGYVTQTLDASSNMTVTLAIDNTKLSEVVVTGLGQFSKKIKSCKCCCIRVRKRSCRNHRSVNG
jgi:iron complex outermembrane receptor protein